jgi:hypothetical protein
MSKKEESLDKNTPIEIPITEEDIQAAVDQARIANNQQQATKNIDPALEALKAKKEQEKLTTDFQEYIDGMPRKMKRNIFPHTKFGNTLEQTLRLRRLQVINAKEKK